MQTASEHNLAAATPVSIQVHRNIAEISDRWRTFQKRAIGDPHDTWEWNEAWARTAGKSCDAYIAVGRDEHGDVVFILPLTIRKRMGCAVLEWLSGDQGNYSSGLFHPKVFKDKKFPRGEALLRHVCLSLPRVDAVHLEGLPDETGGLTSPLAGLPGTDAASMGRAFPLGSDLKQHFNKMFSSKARQQLRRAERRLADEGKLRLVSPKTETARMKAMERMLADKRQWFADRGIQDFLADDDMRGFFQALVQIPHAEGTLQARIYELTVGGEVVASTLGIIHRKTLYGLVASTPNGPLLRYGPGNILFKRMVEHLAKEGIERIDCGACDDEHKGRWCTQQRIRRHAIVPMTAKGRVYAAALESALNAKLKIKHTPALWNAAKKTRQWTAVARKTHAALKERHGDSISAGFQACNNFLKRLPDFVRPLSSQ